jgi:hypothetical protein
MPEPVRRNVPPRVARARSSLGRQTQLDASPELIEQARVELKAANLEAGIRAAVSAWPPLTPEVRSELAILLLTPGGDDAP